MNIENPVLHLMAHESWLPCNSGNHLYRRVLFFTFGSYWWSTTTTNAEGQIGGLQKLWAGYLDGQLDVDGEIMKKYIRDFDFDDEDLMD